MLLCSVGRDETIKFFDIVQNREVKSIATNEPLSAISFCSDGHTIAVGCEKGGKILVYDLKGDTKKKVKIELKGHDGARRINVLLFTRVYKPAT